MSGLAPTERFINGVVDTLNRALESDPEHVRKLFDLHVRCNEALAYDPTIQVNKTADGYEVGLLGIINGIVQDVRSDVVVVIDLDEETGKAQKFRLAHASELKEPPQ